MALSVTTLGIRIECHYGKCYYEESHGTLYIYIYIYTYTITNLDSVIDIRFIENILYSLQIKALGISLSGYSL